MAEQDSSPGDLIKVDLLAKFSPDQRKQISTVEPALLGMLEQVRKNAAPPGSTENFRDDVKILFGLLNNMPTDQKGWKPIALQIAEETGIDLTNLPSDPEERAQLLQTAIESSPIYNRIKIHFTSPPSTESLGERWNRRKSN